MRFILISDEGQVGSSRWYKGKNDVPVQVTKAYGEADLLLYSFFSSALVRGDWSAALPRERNFKCPLDRRPREQRFGRSDE